MSRDPNIAFTLRVPTWVGHDGTKPWGPAVGNDRKRFVTVTVWDDGRPTASHFRLDVEVRHCGKVIFPKGGLYCGIPMGKATDSDYAKHAVLGLVAMRKGDTDADYFADYTPEQMDWANEWGEYLSDYAENRYGRSK